MAPQEGAALLFDIDGTLVDTDHLHLDAFNLVFGPRGEVFDAPRFRAELQGFSMASIANRFLAGEPPDRRLAIMAEKEEIFRSLAAAELEPVPGLMALLDHADAAGLPLAAVTNAPRQNAELILDAIGIRHRFRVVVIGEELAHAKPHPLPYLEGLRLLDATAELSVAFEDSASGVASASAAGIATIGVTTSLSETQLLGSGAIATTRRYDEPALLALLERVISSGHPAPMA